MPLTTPAALTVLERHIKTQKGSCLRGFRSGGRGRVVRVEKNGDLQAYGDHASIDLALRNAAADLENPGVEPPEICVVGNKDPDEGLDAFLHGGGRFRAWYRGGWFFAELHELMRDAPAPPSVRHTVLAGEPTVWVNPRGFRYLLVPVSLGDVAGISYTPLHTPLMRQPTYYPAIRRGLGDTLEEAFAEALKDHPLEDLSHLPEP